MKLIHLPVLCLVLASTAPAADLSPNKIGVLLQKPLPSMAYRLGLDYVQADDEKEQRIIQRRLNLAIGLPAQTEFGFALLDTQEPAIDHSSKPLGAQAWLRWNMMQSSWFTASAILQFQPGLSTSESAYQASQDRTSLGLDLNLEPWSWMSTAVYASYSRRQDERYKQLALSTETLAGARLTFGTENYGIYGEGSQRHLSAKNIETTASQQLFAREWQAGLYLGSADLQIKAFALIPDTHRYFGMPDRGFGAAFTMVIGGSANKVTDIRDQPGDALLVTERADRELSAQQKVQAEPEIKVYETKELDEFQLLEQKSKKEAENQQESPAEKAEREIRQSLEAEKKMAAQKVIEEENAKREAAQVWQRKVQDDDDAYREYKDDVEQEIDQYALPDKDDLNWNGLTP